MFLLDRKHDVENNILPALENNYIVIMDRYYFSTIAYQGARGVDVDKIKEMNEEIAPKPNLVLILDVDPKVGVERIVKRGDEPNKFEDLEYLKRVRSIFLKLRDENVVVIDANRDINTVKKEVLNVVRNLIV